jgi:hypothetical protein
MRRSITANRYVVLAELAGDHFGLVRDAIQYPGIEVTQAGHVYWQSEAQPQSGVDFRETLCDIAYLSFEVRPGLRDVGRSFLDNVFHLVLGERVAFDRCCGLNASGQVAK